MPPPSSQRFRFLVFLAVVLAIVGWFLAYHTRRTNPAVGEPAASTSLSTVALVPASSSPPTASEPSADDEARWNRPPKREGVNAANLYADAFVLFDQLTDEEKAIIRKPTEEVDAEKAARLYEKIQAIMDLMRAAAKAEYCDWGIGDITFATRLPHIEKAQQLAAGAVWSAAYRFRSDPAGAIDDLAVTTQLGHHLSDTLIGLLVNASFEARANSLLIDHIASFDATAMSKARDFVSASTLDSDATRAMNGEQMFVSSWWKRLEGMSTLERGKAILTATNSGPGEASLWDEAKQFAAGMYFTPRRIAEEMTLVGGIQEQAAEAMRGSEAEFQSWQQRAEGELSGASALVRSILPAYDGIQQRMQRSRVERTLLTAGADILQHGPEQIARHRDPATGSPLQYVPTASGFELRSPYLAKGKPVTMAFPRP